MTLPTEPTQLPTRAPHWLTAGPQLLQLPDLFALEVGGEGLQLVLSPGKNISHICFTPGWRGVVVFDQSPVQISGGSALCQDGDISVLTKLQAFMDADCGLAMSHSMPNARLVSCAGTGLAMLSDRRTIENWFLSQMITEPEQMLAISALLRRLESYALVRFLLTERAEKKNLRELAQSYGISYTHFRRLCNRALGGRGPCSIWSTVAVISPKSHSSMGMHRAPIFRTKSGGRSACHHAACQTSLNSQVSNICIARKSHPHHSGHVLFC